MKKVMMAMAAALLLATALVGCECSDECSGASMWCTKCDDRAAPLELEPTESIEDEAPEGEPFFPGA